MTTLTPEKEAELRELLDEGGIRDAREWPEASYLISAALKSLSTERQAREAAEKEVEALRLAIMGGEDAPGYALSLTEAEVLAVLADNYRLPRDRAEAAEAKLAALVEVVEAARDLVMKPGGLVNRGVGVGLVVVEKADKSDPHFRLCAAFEKLDALSALPPPEERGPQLIARYHVPSDVASRPDAYVDVPTQAPQDVAGLVEEIARIIDPHNWSLYREDDRRHMPGDAIAGRKRVRADSLAKANAILSALRPSPISHEDRHLELAAADNNHKALVEALEKAREQFRFYAQQHIAKTPPDYAKGQTNLDMVTMCDAALAAAQPSQQAASAAATKEASGQSRQEGKQP